MTLWKLCKGSVPCTCNTHAGMGGTFAPIMLATAAALDALNPGAPGAGLDGMLGAALAGMFWGGGALPGRLGSGGGGARPGLGEDGRELGLL